jgi:hypothetical protein
MIFQMQEGYLKLGEGDWKDSSVNMLGANHMPVKGTNLVVTRDVLPVGVSLADYLLNQKTILSKELTGFKIVSENTDIINGLQAHFLEFTWDNQGNAMHQMIFIIINNDIALNITSTVPGNIDDESRATLMTAMKSFTAGQAPPQNKEI